MNVSVTHRGSCARFQWIKISVAVLLLLANSCNYMIPHRVKTDRWGCIVPPPDVFSSSGIDVSFAQSTFVNVISGDLNVATRPEVVSLASRATTDARILEYLRCLAIQRDQFNQEQAAYLETMHSFLATDPTAEQFIEFQREFRFPRGPQHSHLAHFYLNEGIVDHGWFGFRPPEELIRNPPRELNIFPVGSVDHIFSFLLASAPKSHCKVEDLYLKLKSYASSDLRNEYFTAQALMRTTTCALHISPLYEIYPIYPLHPPLIRGTWSFRGRDVEEFDLFLSFDDYMLYIITINVDYINLRTGERKHIESDEFALIGVANGNTGGALDIETWFREDMRRSPTPHRYDQGIPFDIYCLLTANFSDNPSLMNIFTENRSLVSRQEEIKRIVSARPENEIFLRNYNAWKAAL